MDQNTTEPTFEKVLSTGQTAYFQRVSLQTWAIFGKMPSHLTELAVNAAGRGGADIKKLAEGFEKQMSPEEKLKTLLFYRDLFTDSLVSPEMEIDTKDPNKLDPAKLNFEKDLGWLVSWQLQGCPGLDVKTKKGAIPLTGLEKFRSGTGRKRGAGASGRSTKLRRKAKR